MVESNIHIIYLPFLAFMSCELHLAVPVKLLINL